MLEIKNLSKNFEKIQALENINLHVKEGEFLSILGGSGSGKSTLLRIIAKLEQASSYDLFSCKGGSGFDVSKLCFISSFKC